MKRNKCRCGCGETTSTGNVYIHNHHWRGKKRSRKSVKKALETKEDLGQIYKPKPKSLQCRCGCGKLARPGNRYIIGHSRQGKKCSLVTRMRISKANKGRIDSEERRKKNSDGHKKNGTEYGKFWVKYHPYMARYQYTHLQKAVIERDHYRCALCHKKNGRFHIHHVVPIRVGYKNRLCDHESNMITLCNSCHAKVEHRKVSDRWKEFLPFAKKYLTKFHYSKLLLNSYL